MLFISLQLISVCENILQSTLTFPCLLPQFVYCQPSNIELIKMENVTETDQLNVILLKHQLFLFKRHIYLRFKLLLLVLCSDKVSSFNDNFNGKVIGICLFTVDECHVTTPSDMGPGYLRVPQRG